ncbi:MAG: SDR family NAD(P)-dependent oxidoreductase [Chloroflexi bacterium]|nr:SDR family NAD(P)-dependent oxidoreductase [Chloroflexota bacterium]
MHKLEGKIAIVTGGSGNLGSAIVAAFHQAGATVVVPDRRAGGVVDMFPELDRDQHNFPGNYNAMDAEANHKLAQDTLSRFGRIDIVVNTIGGYRAGKPLHETEPDTWDFMMNLNAKTAFLLSQAVLPAMLKQGDGVIIHTAAHPALHGTRNESAYAASKAAVARIVESMSEEYKAQGITVNAILPGVLDTPRNRETMPDADFNEWV